MSTTPPPAPIKAKIGMKRIWRNVWGILTLLSLLWIGYGFTISSSAYETVAGRTATEAGRAGAAIGASMGIGVFLCTGGGAFLFCLFLYARNGSAIRKEQQHAETLAAIQQSKQ